MMAIAAKNNPFRSERVNALEYRPQDMSWPELLARLEKLGFRAAIIGPHGHGKTTLLDTLARHLRERGWSTHRLRLNAARRDLAPQEWRGLSTLGPTDAILLDGAEQLSLTRRWKLLASTRCAGGLIVTAHRAGMLPTLCRCRTSPTLLADLVRELAPQRAGDHAGLEVLFRRHKGNVRDALRELYDNVAGELAME